MKQHKHTKGPWSYSNFHEYGNRLVSEITTTDNKRKIAEVFSAVPNLAMDETENDRANAQLISAAPEMLEALEYLFTQTRLDISIDWNDKIRDLLLKARGEA